MLALKIIMFILDIVIVSLILLDMYYQNKTRKYLEEIQGLFGSEHKNLTKKKVELLLDKAYIKCSKKNKHARLSDVGNFLTKEEGSKFYIKMGFETLEKMVESSDKWEIISLDDFNPPVKAIAPVKSLD